eukprot:1712044-Pyramimonas_sp.AAC.1
MLEEVKEGAEVSIALCPKVDTKSKRPQVARLWKADKDIVELLRVARRYTPPGLQVFPYSLATYRRILKQIEGLLGLQVGWGPHSPRAGWASDSRAEGMSFLEVREAGRWVADSSLRTYLDI